MQPSRGGVACFALAGLLSCARSFPGLTPWAGLPDPFRVLNLVAFVTCAAPPRAKRRAAAAPRSARGLLLRQAMQSSKSQNKIHGMNADDGAIGDEFR